MTQDERLIELDSLIRTQGRVTLEYICHHYQVSTDSARRDLVKLAQLPHIMRIRGGAILAEQRTETPYLQRKQVSPEKEKLADWAAKLINHKEIIFIDAGTTSVALAQRLPSDISVITNSIEVLNEVIGERSIRKTVLGGTFDDYSHTILGNSTIEQIKKYRADKAFIGVSALSDCGITTNSEFDALQKKTMAQQSKKVICLTTSVKFNTQRMYQSCSWSDIDHIITDKKPPQNILDKIVEFDVELVILDKE